MSAVQKIEAAERPSTALAVTTPMEMLAAAIERGAGLDVIEKFMALSERWEANQARKAFSEAFVAFKAEAVPIVRNKIVTDGPLKGKRYAELFSFVDAVTPALSRHGLSASWELTKDEKDWIEVTCKIEHILGHSKRVAMGGPPDAGGAKNAIQARASTVTYLERHTLKAACGLAEQGDDVDGRTANGAKISADEATSIREVIEAIGDKSVEPRLLKWLKVESIEAIPHARYDDAMENLKKLSRRS